LQHKNLLSFFLDPIVGIPEANFVEKRHQQQHQLDRRPPVLQQRPPQSAGLPIKIRKKKIPVLQHLRPNVAENVVPKGPSINSESSLDGANNRTEDEKRCE